MIIDTKFKLITRNCMHMLPAVQAVMWPILKLHNFPVITAEMIRELQRMWRDRAKQLHDCGWSYLAPVDKLRLARNCMPVACYFSPTTYACHKDSLCPFCWFRLVIRSSELARKLFCGHRNMMLVSCTTPCQYAVDTNLSDGLSEMIDTRSRLRRSLAPLAGMFCITVEPDNISWRVCSNFLLMLENDKKLPEWLKEKGSVIKRPRQVDVDNAVSSVLRYPRGLLTEDVNMVMEILKAREGMRLSALSGLFRKKGTRVACDEEAQFEESGLPEVQ